MVLDALSVASKSVSYLLDRKLDVPPVPIKTVRKQDNGDTIDGKEELPHGFQLPEKDVQVYEVWKVFLEENSQEYDSLFVVLSAIFSQEGYKNGDWSNVEYRGFYTTLEEAQNEINGYLR